MSHELKFELPGPGTAMAFAAAVALGGAAYSHADLLISVILIVVAIGFGISVYKIEIISGPYATNMTNEQKDLASIERLCKMSQKRIITKEEFQEIKKSILSRFKTVTQME